MAVPYPSPATRRSQTSSPVGSAGSSASRHRELDAHRCDARHTTCIYAALRDANPLEALAEDLARFLELPGSEWSGEPSELYLQLESHHKPNRAHEFGKMVRAATKREARLAFDDRHERVSKPDGTSSTRRVMELKLIVTETS